MRLESIIDPDCYDEYRFTLSDEICFQETIREIVGDLQRKTPASIISAKFHNTIISIIFAAVSKLADNTGIRKVVLSGGTFQNKYILEKIELKLEGNGMMVYSPHQVPANDGGIALGQLVIAAKRRI